MPFMPRGFAWAFCPVCGSKKVVAMGMRGWTGTEAGRSCAQCNPPPPVRPYAEGCKAGCDAGGFRFVRGVFSPKSGPPLPLVSPELAAPALGASLLRLHVALTQRELWHALRAVARDALPADSITL